MIERVIDSVIDADNMLVLKRTAIFMDALAQKSKKQFGAPIDPAAGHLFYVSGNPGNLSEAQQAFIQELAAECRAASAKASSSCCFWPVFRSADCWMRPL